MKFLAKYLPGRSATMGHNIYVTFFDNGRTRIIVDGYDDPFFSNWEYSNDGVRFWKNDVETPFPEGPKKEMLCVDLEADSSSQAFWLDLIFNDDSRSYFNFFINNK